MVIFTIDGYYNTVITIPLWTCYHLWMIHWFTYETLPFSLAMLDFQRLLIPIDDFRRLQRSVLQDSPGWLWRLAGKIMNYGWWIFGPVMFDYAFYGPSLRPAVCLIGPRIWLSRQTAAQRGDTGRISTIPSPVHIKHTHSKMSQISVNFWLNHDFWRCLSF